MQTEEGIEPTTVVFSSDSHSSEVKFPNTAGIVPTSWFPDRPSPFMPVRDPISVGMEPVR